MKAVLLVLDAALAQNLISRLVATTLVRVGVLKTALQVRYLVPTLYVVSLIIIIIIIIDGINVFAGCSTLNDPNGQFSYSNDTDIDSMATLACNTGYMDNDSPATCTQSGDWTTTPNCTRK